MADFTIQLSSEPQEIYRDSDSLDSTDVKTINENIPINSVEVNTAQNNVHMFINSSETVPDIIYQDSGDNKADENSSRNKILEATRKQNKHVLAFEPSAAPPPPQMAQVTGNVQGAQRMRRRVKRKPQAETQAQQRAENTASSASSGSKKIFIIVGIVVAVCVAAGIGIYLSMSGVIDNTATTTVGPTRAPVTTPPPESTGDKVLTLQSMSQQKWESIRGIECGKQSIKPDLNARIVGGTLAKQHSWPWQIGLIKYRDYGGGKASVKAICGGTLVGPRFVITAVHCFLNSARTSVSKNANNYRVLIGGHIKGLEKNGAEYREIFSIQHHPKNNLAFFTAKREIPVYDITLLLLKDDVDPRADKPVTAFACLPRPQLIHPSGKKCWATGWGKTMGTGHDKELKQVPQPIVSEETCRKKYATKGIENEIHVCGGPYLNTQGTCQGDSGGPLVCQEKDGRWTVHGATSFGPKPCGTNPAVWAQVSFFIDWLCCYIKDYGPCKEVKCVMPS